MKYILKIHALGRFPEIDITEEQFESIKNARKALTNGIEVEDKYGILIANYLDFEKELLKISAQSMVRDACEYGEFFNATLGFNRRLVNLLSSCRLYVDQISSSIKRILPDVSTIKKEVKELFSTEYDNNQEYRFMEALRNHTQHHGTPVHFTQFKTYRDKDKDFNKLVFTMEIASEKIHLKEDRDFKKLVLNEMPDKIDLKKYTRVYIECISRIHQQIRNMIEKPLINSRKIIEEAISSYKKKYSEKIVGLHSMCINENKIIDKNSLILTWDDIRIKLVKRNKELINLRHRHVTSETIT